MLTDIVAYTLDIDLDAKVRLLAESDVVLRTRLLLEVMAGRGPGGGGRPFPPEFSRN